MRTSLNTRESGLRKADLFRLRSLVRAAAATADTCRKGRVIIQTSSKTALQYLNLVTPKASHTSNRKIVASIFNQKRNRSPLPRRAE